MEIRSPSLPVARPPGNTDAVRIGPWAIGTVGVVAGVAFAYHEVAVVGRAWAACDAGSGPANGFVLLFSLLVLTGMHTLLVISTVGVLAVSRRRPPIRATLAGLLAVVVLLAVIGLLAWGFFAFIGLPLANDACPAGEPIWWPDWLPPAVETYS